MNRITCLIHSVRVGSPGPPNIVDFVTFPVGIATPAALVAPWRHNGGSPVPCQSDTNMYI